MFSVPPPSSALAAFSINGCACHFIHKREPKKKKRKKCPMNK